MGPIGFDKTIYQGYFGVPPRGKRKQHFLKGKNMTSASFQPGNVYSTASACDSNCIFRFKVIRRTASSVWVCPVRNGNVLEEETKRRSIIKWDGEPERIFPMGKFSMAPMLSAN